MRSILRTFLFASAVAGCFTACNNDDIGPDTPDTPTAECHLRFSGSVDDDNAATRAKWTDNNDGKLTFAWDYQESDATTSDLKMAFINDDGDYLMNSELSSVTQARVLRHTDPAKADDKHWAEFETIEGFDPQWTDDNFDGYRVYAVTPINDVNNSQVNVKLENDIAEFYATLKMPTTFTQSGENNLAHLSDYMYMYATDVLEGRTASLHFAHLASYIRFKVYNWRGVPATLYGVKLEVVDAGGNAVPASGSQANYTYDGFVYTPATDGNGIQVNLADGGLTVEDNVFLYAPVFPVGTENPFQNSTLRFTLIAQDPTGAATQGEYKYFTYELNGEVFKEATSSYDWQAGDLYTFHLYLDDVLTVGKVTVNDWYEGGTIVDGEAVEWVNGINTETGEYEPAQLNWDDYYEIKNAGNLFWFAQQVNDSSDPDNSELCAVLMADIDLENRPWTPIGNEEMPYKGHFDGNGHTITGFSLNATTAGDWGLFGYVSGATIENFSISGSAVSSLTAKGESEQFDYGVIGESSYGTTVTNVHSAVNFTSNDSFMKNTIGGIVGKTGEKGEGLCIERCSFGGILDMGSTDVDCLGGIIGYIFATIPTTITDCAFYGTVTSSHTGQDQMGGILGYYRGSNLTIHNCLSVGTFAITDSTLNGSIMGVLRQHGSANTIVTNNYYLSGNAFGNSSANDDITDGYGGQTVEQSATVTSEAELANGSIAGKLGDAWEQGEKFPILKK